MIRRVLSLAVVVAALSAGACSPSYEVEFNWTIDGGDAAATCGEIGDATVRLTAQNRDNADARFPGATSETVVEGLACDKGTATLTTGNFATVVAELVSGDTVFGTAAPVEVSPGSASDGYNGPADPVVADIALQNGTLHATLTAVDQACGDAGVSSFTVTLFKNVEPRTNVAVKDATDVEVACDGDAVFTFAPVELGAQYFIEAKAAGFATTPGGEGFEIDGANTFVTIDLAAE